MIVSVSSLCPLAAGVPGLSRPPWGRMIPWIWFAQSAPQDPAPNPNSTVPDDRVIPFCDPEEYRQLVDLHYKRLYLFALSLSKSDHDAWDLTHETYDRWTRSHHKIRDKSKTRSWLYSTLYRCFLDHCRRRRRHVELPVTETAAAAEPSAGRALDRSTVLRALQGLPEKYRAPLSLFYLEDCSCRDISEVLHLRPGTVMSRLSRAKAMLAQRLEADPPSPPPL